ncbi:uncharacterized protein VTP21DRAFT_10611 [Calcarisporiella thermophila]|uniref:uncharacterized protein n=1 Tax=Calcarisporiella thermophila TaxID=911321 RepID=UPI003742B0E3
MKDPQREKDSEPSGENKRKKKVIYLRISQPYLSKPRNPVNCTTPMDAIWLVQDVIRLGRPPVGKLAIPGQPPPALATAEACLRQIIPPAADPPESTKTCFPGMGVLNAPPPPWLSSSSYPGCSICPPFLLYSSLLDREGSLARFP